MIRDTSTAQTLSNWARQAERDQGQRPGTTTDDRERIKALEREVPQEIWQNFQVYGVRKVRRQLRREGFDVARCTVARLMMKMALQGMIRGRRVRTRHGCSAPARSVSRRFKAPRPNVLWVSDFTYVATWVG